MGHPAPVLIGQQGVELRVQRDTVLLHPCPGALGASAKAAGKELKAEGLALRAVAGRRSPNVLGASSGVLQVSSCVSPHEYMKRGEVASSGRSRLGAAAHCTSGGTIKCLYMIFGGKSPGSSCCGKGSGDYAGHKPDCSAAWGNQQCFLWDWKEQGWGQSQRRVVLRDGHRGKLGESTEGAQSMQEKLQRADRKG